MKKNIIITCLLALAALTAQGQTDSTKTEKKKAERKVGLHGTVADAFTKAAVPDVFVTLMRPDSAMVDTQRVYKGTYHTYGIGRRELTGYEFMIKAEAGQYILKFEHPNYETAFADVSIKHVSRRQQDVEGPNVYLKKTMKAHHFEGGELDEVVVKATKVKMVWRGDTLVYNADAFNVPEGSMLDGLIKQLPGVELTDAGEIFVNGKKVENLTLNGADFFKGKNKVMLENLPYFTVKNVEVYNKQTPQNKYLGIEDEDKKEYTMDVVLKREYSIGGTANVEAGAAPLLSPLGGTTSAGTSSPQGGTGGGPRTGGGLLSRVDNLLLRYKPSLRFQKNNLTLRLKGELAYRNIHREPSPQGGTGGGLPTDLWDFSYGLYAQYKLPLDFTIDSDVQMHSRRGYSDAEMNDNRLYWDASLTKSLNKGRWVLKLRGYDLLGQVSNLRYSINAQGRTETWNNVLKRYVMLTASYRFSQKPKKR